MILSEYILLWFQFASLFLSVSDFLSSKITFFNKIYGCREGAKYQNWHYQNFSHNVGIGWDFVQQIHLKASNWYMRTITQLYCEESICNCEGNSLITFNLKFRNYYTDYSRTPKPAHITKEHKSYTWVLIHIWEINRPTQSNITQIITQPTHPIDL